MCVCVCVRIYIYIYNILFGRDERKKRIGGVDMGGDTQYVYMYIGDKGPE